MATRATIFHGLTLLGLLFAGGLAAGTARAEAIKIGIIRQPNGAALYVAQERGYFAAQGLDAAFVNFDSAQPIAVAVASGDIDFGVTALTAGFYNLAGQGVLRIIAAQTREQPGFRDQAWLLSARAGAAGLAALKDMPGHTIGVTQVGASSHYAIGLAAEKYGFAMSSLRVVPLQSISNLASALIGGQADLAAVTMTPPPTTGRRW
jgi:NitT/TauT family transport system substrate-binding protein